MRPDSVQWIQNLNSGIPLQKEDPPKGEGGRVIDQLLIKAVAAALLVYGSGKLWLSTTYSQELLG